MRVTMSMTVCSVVNHDAKNPGNAASTDTNAVAEAICVTKAMRIACRTRRILRAPKLNPMIGWMPC